MIYDFEGHFIEACDCFELCPCWVDDQPDEGHCTGLVAWDIEQGTIDDVRVSGRKVVAVTSHGPARRDSRATTVLYVDGRAGPQQRKALEQAFRGRLGDGRDPLAVLMDVTGTVVGVETAPIEIKTTADGWSIRVGTNGSAAVSARGGSLHFEGESTALTLHHTALHRELQIVGPSEAQRGEELRIAVPALRGGGYVEATARSGMRGDFRYRH